MAIRVERENGKQLPRESSVASAMGAMVVDPILSFDRKVAEIRTNKGQDGYLFVKLQLQPWSGGKDDIGVDLNVVIDGDDGWVFSDRSDLEPDDAREELRSGIIEWFGKQLNIVRWLDNAAAQEVRKTHFA